LPSAASLSRMEAHPKSGLRVLACPAGIKIQSF
jgi:hypothetical protein